MGTFLLLDQIERRSYSDMASGITPDFCPGSVTSMRGGPPFSHAARYRSCMEVLAGVKAE